MPTRWVPLALTVLTLSALPSGAIEPPRAYDLYLWPLLTIDQDETGSETRFLIPLGEFSDKDGVTVRAVYPFAAWKHKEDGERSTDVLWPFARFSRKPDGSRRRRVFPAFWDAKPSGTRHLSVFPLVWTWWHTFRPPGDEWGVVVVPAWNVEDYGEGNTDYHRGLAPLCWAWRDETNRGFWAMPVYWQQDEANDERTFGILPFYLDWRDGDEHGTWALPFYWQRWQGETTRFVVFPLYWQGEDTRVVFPFYWSFDDGKTRVLFPVYGRRKGGGRDFLLVLWPAYLRCSSDGEHFVHRVLWPLLKWGSDRPGDSEFALWPLFGMERDSWGSERYERKDHDRWALWPLAWWGHSESISRPKANEDGDDEPQSTIRKRHYLNLSPLYWSRASKTWALLENDEPGDLTDSEYRNWLLPFYTYDKDLERTVLTTLWPLWRDASSGEMDQYSILWRLLDARYYKNGDKRVSVLWRGYRDEKRGNVHKVDVFPFITYRRTGTEQKRFQFLGGLFQLGSESGQRHMRLFYSPRIPLGSGD